MSEDVQTTPEAPAETQSPVNAPALPPEELEAFGNQLIVALKTVYDPKTEPSGFQLEAEENRGTFSTKGFWMGKYTVTQAEWAAQRRQFQPERRHSKMMSWLLR